MLVITIVILGILASAVILSIKNTSVIDEAESVVFKSDMTTYNDAYDMYVVKKTMQDITFDETNLNLTYKDAEFENIFGKVPDKYKESLKIIKGKLVYITTDKKESEIIQDMGMIPNKMKITNRLVHCTTNNTATSVAYEKGYESTLKVDTGYTLQKVTVVMGGVDITSSAYNSSGNTIKIDKVTDNVVITATTDANTYTITNNLTQVVNLNEAATAKTGTSYIAELTEKTGYTLKTVKVTMAGSDETSRVYDSSTKTITINSVKGDIIITASATANVYSVKNNLTNVTTSNTNTNTTYGSEYTAKLTPDDDYTIKTVTVLVNNVDVTKSAYDSSSNTITINSVTGEIVITAVAKKVIMYSITYNLTHTYTSFNLAESIEEGSSFFITLCSEYYDTVSYYLYMDGLEVTNGVLEPGECADVSFQNVSGNLMLFDDIGIPDIPVDPPTPDWDDD